MELKVIGKADAPEVLLFSGAEALQALENKYRLFLPTFDEEKTSKERLAALEEAILRDYGGRIRGLYAFGKDATLALRLLSRGRVRVRTAVLEGVFPLPKTLNSPLPGRIYYWFRKNDKTSQKIRDALKKHAVPLSTVTMKKLRRGKALMDQRPDMAVGLLEKAFGDGVTVTLSDTLPDSPENVWRELSLFPAGGETAVLTKLEPIRCEDDDRVQILEGSSKRLRMWSHMIRLEDAGEDKTRVVDQVELDASRLNVLAKPLAALYLREQQLRRRLALKSGRHAL